MSMSLRGWITEEDETFTPGANGAQPAAIAIRGYSDQGDATEDYSVDAAGVAHWKTPVDGGEAPLGAKRYNPFGGPWLAGENDINALVAAGDKGIDLLPIGHASIAIKQSVQIDGPQDGDVSKDVGNLGHVDTVFLDGYHLNGEQLREASGLYGMPK